MIQLHTLGDARIVIGRREIRPTSPVLFAALLYLAVERGRRVPRAALQEMLFPESSERSGAHSLRQLLYKLRRLGAPIEADDTTAWIAADAVHDPLAGGDGGVSIDALAAGFLPGYARPEAEAYSRWLDGVRDRATLEIVQRLKTRLERAKESGDVGQGLRIAGALLELDPLNEVATLAKAESLALTGSKHEALRVLESYEADVGPGAPELRLPAQLLRRRISERVEPPDPSRPPLVGRSKELAWLLAQHKRAASGRPTISIVWGDPGIGKTRLVQEFLEHLKLGNARVVKAQCQPHDATRPLGAISDFVPQLLQTRGALGVAPESMSWLKRLDSTSESIQPADVNPQYVTARLRAALIDLLTSIASEGPIVLVVEDTQWLDEASARFLLTVAPTVEGRVQVVLTRRPQGVFFEGIQLTEDVFVQQLLPLDEAAAEELLTQSLRNLKVLSVELKSACLTLAAGNPLFLRSIGEHLQLRGSIPSSDFGIADLLTQRVRVLDPTSLLMLRSAAVLGALGTFERISHCAGQSGASAMLALQNLADRGLLVRSAETIHCCHDLLAEAVLADSTPPVRLQLHERAAALLEEEGLMRRQTSLLWSCAEHWSKAEQSTRAANVLRRCASMALSVGQPVFAVSSLERAQELCCHADLLEVFDETLRAAESVPDNQAVLRNVARFRALTGEPARVTVTAFIDLAELNAQRRMGTDIWPSRDLIRRCATSPEAALEDRRRAARIYLIAADEALCREAAIEFAREASGLWLTDDECLSALELRMYYETMFGSVANSAPTARRVVTLTRSLDPPSQPRLLANSAYVLFTTGATSEAIDVAGEAVQISDRLGRFEESLHPMARLVDFYLTVGDMEAARNWLSRAQALYADANTSAGYYFLAHRIVRALVDSDFEAAAADLAALKSGREYSKMHAKRSVLGLELLLGARLGFDQLGLDLTSLEAIDERGSYHGAHLPFAVGLYLATRAAGEEERAAKRLRDFVSNRRRELFAIRPAISLLGLTNEEIERVLAVVA